MGLEFARKAKATTVAPAKSDAPPPPVHAVLRSPGQPLDGGTRALLEPRFGHDFSGVRVHTDGDAGEAASSIGARAFTSGHRIAFAAGEYAPHSQAGLRLLAHELSHVVQQAAAVHPKDGVSEVADPHEREADAIAERVSLEPSGRPRHKGEARHDGGKRVPTGARHAIQRQALPWRRHESADVREFDEGPPWLWGQPFRFQPLTWLNVIPDAVIKAGAKKRSAVRGEASAQGPLTNYAGGTFSYHKSAQKAAAHDIAEGGPLGLRVDQDKVNAAVAAVTQARNKIHQRFLRKVNTGLMATTGQDAGLASEMAKGVTPKSKEKPATWAAKEAAANPNWKEGTDASERYSKWLASAVPTGVQANDPKWLIYKTIVPWEGNTSSINAWDRANVTWGSGFAPTGGQVQDLTQRVFDKSPESRRAFFNAGIALDDHKQ